jgi:hypothetical protein
MTGKNAITLIFASLLIRESWILLRLFEPFIHGEITPFPFYPITLAIETYAYFACYYLSMMIIAWAFVLIIPQYHVILAAWFFLQGVELIDYFLTYNTPWFFIGKLGISITLIKFLILGFLMIQEWTKR